MQPNSEIFPWYTDISHLLTLSSKYITINVTIHWFTILHGSKVKYLSLKHSYYSKFRLSRKTEQDDVCRDMRAGDLCRRYDLTALGGQTKTRRSENKTCLLQESFRCSGTEQHRRLGTGFQSTLSQPKTLDYSRSSSRLFYSALHALSVTYLVIGLLCCVLDCSQLVFPGTYVKGSWSSCKRRSTND